MRPAQTPGGSVRSEDSGRRPRWVSVADVPPSMSPCDVTPQLPPSRRRPLLDALELRTSGFY